MHPHNRAHGAAHILAVAAAENRVWTVPSIPGHVQHSSDLFAPCPQESTLPRALTAFVWSRSAVRRRARRGFRNQVATGSPWLHLLQIDPDLLEVARPVDALTGKPKARTEEEIDPTGTLLFVEHGLDGGLLAPRVVEAARAAFDSPITVALSHRDAATAPIRAAYEALGVETVDRGPAADASGSAEPRELLRLYRLMKNFAHVAANTAREELFYATSLERPIAVVGPSPDGRPPAATAEELVAMTDDELGRGDMLEPQELNDLFEWSARRG